MSFPLERTIPICGSWDIERDRRWRLQGFGGKELVPQKKNSQRPPSLRSHKRRAEYQTHSTLRAGQSSTDTPHNPSWPRGSPRLDRNVHVARDLPRTPASHDSRDKLHLGRCDAYSPGVLVSLPRGFEHPAGHASRPLEQTGYSRRILDVHWVFHPHRWQMLGVVALPAIHKLVSVRCQFEVLDSILVLQYGINPHGGISLASNNQKIMDR